MEKQKKAKMEPTINDYMDDLFATLSFLMHHYRDMAERIARNEYTPDDAERDAELLMTTEHGDVLGILHDIARVRTTDISGMVEA